MSEIPNSSHEGTVPTMTPIDPASWLHPSERSRLVIALVGCIGVFVGVAALVVVAVDFTFLIVLIGVFAILLGFIWVVIQLFRARLLANAVRVEPEALPDLYTALVAVRNQLGFRQSHDHGERAGWTTFYSR